MKINIKAEEIIFKAFFYPFYSQEKKWGKSNLDKSRPRVQPDMFLFFIYMF